MLTEKLTPRFFLRQASINIRVSPPDPLNDASLARFRNSYRRKYRHSGVVTYDTGGFRHYINRHPANRVGRLRGSRDLVTSKVQCLQSASAHLKDAAARPPAWFTSANLSRPPSRLFKLGSMPRTRMGEGLRRSCHPHIFPQPLEELAHVAVRHGAERIRGDDILIVGGIPLQVIACALPSRSPATKRRESVDGGVIPISRSRSVRTDLHPDLPRVQPDTSQRGLLPRSQGRELKPTLAIRDGAGPSPTATTAL